MNIFSAPAFLQFVQMLICMLILLRLLSFRAPASRHKPWLAALAYLLIIAAASVLITGMFKHATPVGWAGLVLQSALCAAILLARGNLSLLFKYADKDKNMNLLLIGSHGLAVSELQALLSQQGFNVINDGWFGEATQAALIQYQTAHDLVVDGIAGGNTLATLRAGKRSPQLLSEADLLKAAATLEVPVASVRTINAVESRGSGFLPNGRAVILFERHKMYQFIKAAGLDADALAVKYPNLVNPKRGGYSGGTAECLRLDMAMQIHAESAIAATSWGLFQIMGMHWQKLGYESAAAMMLAMGESEGQQLDAFVRFVQNDEALHKAIKAKKWADVARLYNGPAYKENLYDIKLARTFEKFAAAV